MRCLGECSAHDDRNWPVAIDGLGERTPAKRLGERSLRRGPVISKPPWVYGCVIEDPNEWALIERVLERPWARGRMVAEKVGSVARLVRFSSLEALHDFLRILCRRYALTGDSITRDVIEFVMWTLGFRWV